MPTIRATVTVEAAMPYSSRPTAATAAVERGVTVAPKPRPNTASAAAADADGRRGRPARHHDQRADRRDEPDQRHEAQRQDPDDEPGRERADRRRPRERAQRQALVVGAAVEHAIDEHRAADDRGGQRVARQRGDHGRRREAGVAEQPRVEERVADAQPAHDGGDARDHGDDREDGGDHRRVEAAGLGLRAAAEQRQRTERPDQEGREQDRADDVEAAWSPRRLPAAARGPGDDEGHDPDRDVDVEDPAPGGHQEAAGRSSPDSTPSCDSAAAGWTRAQDRGAQERAGGHAQERQRRDEAEGPRASGAREQVRGGRRRDRDERPAADGLDEAGGDQDLEGRGHPGEQAADREHHERPQEHAPGAPQVGEPPGQRHRDDRHEQVAVDDPRRLAEARSSRRSRPRSRAGRRP